MNQSAPPTRVNLRKFPLPVPAALHRHWPLAPGKVFLNHGSFGACPRPILNLQARLRRQLEAEPVQFLWRRYEEWLEPSRAEVARFVGARPQDLVFVTNATTGVNAVVRSLRLRRGDELLTTNHDYNACHNVLIEIARRTGARVVVAQIPFPIRDAAQVLEAVDRATTRRTRLALIDHVTSSTALVLPVRALVRQLQARGVEVLVDGAHTPGMLPLNLPELQPSFYTGNLHKWVCAPKGAAFLWVREDLQAMMQPPVVSHGNNTPRPGFSPFQDRFDWAGTSDPTPWFCAGAAIRWLGGLLPGGWPRLMRHNHELARTARRSLCRILAVEPPCPESMLGSMATIPLPDRFQGIPKLGRIDEEQTQLYEVAHVEVPFFRFGQPERRFIRISAQAYNSPAQYRYLGQCLQRLYP